MTSTYTPEAPAPESSGPRSSGPRSSGPRSSGPLSPRGYWAPDSGAGQLDAGTSNCATLERWQRGQRWTRAH